MKKDIEWLKDILFDENVIRLFPNDIEKLHELINQLDEPEVLSQEFINEKAVEVYANTADAEVHAVFRMRDLQNLLVPKQKLVEENKRLNGLLITMQEEVDRAYRKGFKEGERQTAEYFESITEEPSKEQVWKYLSEHGIKIADKEPETVADVITNFWKSYERLKEVMSMEVEELEE